MPELPEVETVKNELLPHVVGRVITGVSLHWEKTLKQPSPAEFQRRIVGRKITGLSRRGKYLVFQLDGCGLLLAHLKMSGSLLVGKGEPPPYARAVIHLDDGSTIFFRDPRKFGRLQLVKDNCEALCKLGPEPLLPEFTPEKLGGILSKRKAPVKAVLLDQCLIAGIGNMYADEALFSAGIHPSKPANSLSQDEVCRLHKAIQEVLKAAIENKGASISSYFRPSGEKGNAHSDFRVAHRGGKTCPVCGTTIERLPIRQRSSYFCPRCQPER
jgi:formamidopyrimidine-DNA glycosylase